jgi:hypothetical protein
MKEILGKDWDNIDYPLEVDDDTCLLEMTASSEGRSRFFIIGAREHLSLEKLVRKVLKADYNPSGYSVKRLSIQSPSMGGSNYCAIRTMDHFEERKFHTPEHLERVLNESCVCWTSGDYYFDLE